MLWVWQAWTTSCWPNCGQTPSNALQLKKEKSLPQTKGGRWQSGTEAGRARRGPRGPCQGSPLDDELDAVAGLQDLPELGDPKAVGPAEGDAFRQPHHKELVWIHQELGVGHLDRLRGANGLGCGDTAAVGPPKAMGHKPQFPPPTGCGAPQGQSPLESVLS